MDIVLLMCLLFPSSLTQKSSFFCKNVPFASVHQFFFQMKTLKCIIQSNFSAEVFNTFMKRTILQ